MPGTHTLISSSKLVINIPEGLGDIKSMLLVWEHVGLGMSMESYVKNRS